MFREDALSGNPDIEAVPKQDVIDRLHNATRGTIKGPYHKTRHGFEILERIDQGWFDNNRGTLTSYARSFSRN